MYLSLNWLKDYVEIPKSITPDDLGLKMTMHTFEIDGVEKQSEKFKDVVVGKILEIKPHPNADRLQLAKVEVGKEKLDIVCGAPNIKVGQIVPVALIGSVLPNGMEIKEAEVRGEKSQGMMCAEDELGLGDDHSGIMDLNAKAKIGQNFSDYLKLDDVIFEVDNKTITNRPDLWGHYGVAREVASFLDSNFKEYKTKDIVVDEDNKLDIKVDDFELCPRYMAVKLDGVEIKDSPKFIQERLIAVGMRPINNIVDITNYVMLELGQPMHAFDGGKIKKIIVRSAKKNETINTLDGEERELNEEMLVIADEKNPIAIAGVMGGANSEVSSDTTSIILESANFEYVSIRKTSQKLKLRSEASMRFEKSLDPNMCETALLKAVELIKDDCKEAKVASQILDVKKSEDYGLNTGPIKIDLDWIYEKIGQNIEKEDGKDIKKILTSLGFRIQEEGSALSITIPTWRATKDVSIKEDILEEVARMFGYDNIKPKMPSMEIKRPIVNEQRKLEREIKQILSKSSSLSEVYNYSFVGDALLNKLNIDSSDYIKLANPISNVHTLLRKNLATNLFQDVKINQARYDYINLFEIGSIYLPIEGEMRKSDKKEGYLPYQERKLGIVLAGQKKDVIYDKIKGIVKNLINELSLEVLFESSDAFNTWEEDCCSARVFVEGRFLGSISTLKDDVAKKLGIKKKVAIAEISLKELFNITKDKKEEINSRFTAFEKFPPLTRDLAFVVNEKVLYNDIRNEIIKFNEIIKEVDLFDIYQGEKLGKNLKSLAFHIVYQTEKTLTNNEVDVIQKDLVKNLEKKFEARIRDF